MGPDTGIEDALGSLLMYRSRPATPSTALVLQVALLSVGSWTGCSGEPVGTDAGPVDVGVPDAGPPARRDSGPRDPERPAPRLDSVSPSSGPSSGGTRVILRGANFVDPAEVYFGDTAATSVVVLDAVSIAATTPASAVGTVDVRVQTDDGEVTLPNGYRYRRDLRVLRVEPARLPEEGGVPVVVEGRGFDEDTLILFERRPLVGARVVSDARIEGFAPALAPGRPEIYAAARDADDRRSDLVVVYATPELEALAPGYGPIGGGARQALQGSGFTEAARVELGGQRGAELARVDDTRVEVEAPALAEGAHDVLVANADAQDRLVGGYVAYDPRSTDLAILGVTPPRAADTGGDVVALVGRGFDRDAAVTIGGRTAVVTEVDGAHAIHVLVPAGLPRGPADVQVVTRGSTVSSSGALQIFTPLGVASIRPTRGPAAGGTAVTIIGAGFSQAGVELRLGDLRLTDVVVVDDTTVTAMTPPGTQGLHDVVARMPGSRARLERAYRYEEDFEVIRIDPVEGSIAGNTFVSIYGRGFAGTASASFGGLVTDSVTIENGSVMSTRTQASRSGTVDVFVGVTTGRDTLTNAYSYYDPRIVTGGAWGGPVSGSVNVGVLNGQGTGIPGMVVQLGLDADPRYAAITDENGLATISGPDVRGPQTVTVGQTGFEFVTYPEIDARNLTMYSDAYPASPPPDAPISPCPAGGEAPIVRGKLFKFKSSIDPVTRPGWIPLARITYSDANVFAPNPPQPPEQVDFVFEDGGEFEIVVMRGGTVALYAVLGDFDPMNQIFIPRTMGIVRSVPAAPGQVIEGVNISLDIPLERSVVLRLDDPPLINPGPTLGAVFPFLNLGSDGVIPFDPTVVAGDASILVEALPSLPGADFYYMAGSFTDRGGGQIGAPYSLTLGQSDDDGTNGVDVGPFLRMPEDVRPRPAGLLEDGRLSWAQPGIKPDATSIFVVDSTSVAGQCCIDLDENGECSASEPVQGGSAPVQFNRWSVFAAGGSQSYPLPAMPAPVTAFQTPRQYQWITQQAIAPRFDYREWILNQYSPYFWKSWTVSFSQFLAKEETD